MKTFVIFISLMLGSLIGFAGNDTILQNGNQLVYTSHYDNGQLREVGKYDVDKKRIGTWLSYNQNGTLRTEASFKNDKKHGVWKHYDLNGELKAVITYKKNKIITAYCVTDTGTLLANGH
jgi:antitoxin component YwqK of YwqJK toxin-antitoxin module